MHTTTRRVIAITGAGQGIGAAIAARAAARGAVVALGDLDESSVQSVGASLGGLGVGLDVSDPVSFRAFVDRVVAELGGLDVLVNNAGVMFTGRVGDESDAASRRTIDVNLGGVVTGTKLALEHMVPAGRGHVINIASMLGQLPCPGVATYCATKAGVIAFTDAVRREVAGRGVELSVVLPAFVDSAMTRELGKVRGFANLTPDQVATAVLDTVERPRRQVYVPRSSGLTLQSQRLMSGRVIDLALRPFGLDRLFL